MSIDTSAAIIVGLHRNDLLAADLDLDELDGELEQVAPYYDGGEDAIWGLKVATTGSYDARELPEDLAIRIVNAKAAFNASTGLDAKVWLSPCVF